MTASEVLEIMRRAWETNAPMLRMLYGVGGGMGKMHSTRMLREAVKSPAKGDSFQTMHAMFFVQTLPVPPSRVRPIQYVNGMGFEHPHNIALAKVRPLGGSQSQTVAMQHGGQSSCGCCQAC